MPGPNSQLPVKNRARRRVVRARIPFSAYDDIVISFRRFKTAKHRRSERFNQAVFRTPLFSFKETSVAIKRRPRQEYLAFPKPSLSQLTAQTGLALALIVIGAIGSLYFATHLKTEPQLYISGKPASGQPVSSNKTAEALGAQLKATRLNLVKPVAVARQKPKPPLLPPVMARSEPLRIRIPKIQIDTSLLPVDLSPSKAIAMPNVFDQAGWYDKSPTPGERGPSVIVGHVDSPYGIAIFWNLRELLAGDTVQIVRQDNTVATFKVTDIEQFPQDKFPSQAVYGNTDFAGIRLITCGGTFDKATGHYNLNTVVYGVLETKVLASSTINHS